MSAAGPSNCSSQVPPAKTSHELFKIGVEWWSEIFIFYGLLSAIAIWEIGKFAKKSKYQLQRVDILEEKHRDIATQVLDLEDSIEAVEHKTRTAIHDLTLNLRRLQQSSESKHL